MILWWAIVGGALVGWGSHAQWARRAIPDVRRVRIGIGQYRGQIVVYLDGVYWGGIASSRSIQFARDLLAAACPLRSDVRECAMMRIRLECEAKNDE